MRARRVWGAALSAGLALWTAPGAAALCPPPRPEPPEPPSRHEHHEPRARHGSPEPSEDRGSSRGWEVLEDPESREEREPSTDPEPSKEPESSGEPEPPGPRRSPPPSPDPRPRYPSGRPAEVRVDVGFERGKGPGARDGRVTATIGIRVVRGAARKARLTVTGPVRWSWIPSSCEVKGARLSCEMGDLAGITVLRLGLREKEAAGRDEGLRTVVESENTPKVVKTVRLPGRGPGPGEAVRHRVLGSGPSDTGIVERVERRKPSRSVDLPRSPSSPLSPGAVRPPASVEPPLAPPVLPKAPVVALPPVGPSGTAEPSPRLSVTSAEGPLANDGRGWLVALAVALAGEAAVAWSVVVLALWRRRT